MLSTIFRKPKTTRLVVFDALDRIVESLATGHKPLGRPAVTWDANDAPSGIYYYRLETAGLVLTESMFPAK